MGHGPWPAAWAELGRCGGLPLYPLTLVMHGSWAMTSLGRTGRLASGGLSRRGALTGARELQISALPQCRFL